MSEGTKPKATIPIDDFRQMQEAIDIIISKVRFIELKLQTYDKT